MGNTQDIYFITVKGVRAATAGRPYTNALGMNWITAKG